MTHTNKAAKVHVTLAMLVGVPHYILTLFLTSCVQRVLVEEPTPAEAAAMLHGMLPKLAEHHGVQYTSQAVREAVRLSRRYESSQQTLL